MRDFTESLTLARTGGANQFERWLVPERHVRCPATGPLGPRKRIALAAPPHRELLAARSVPSDRRTTRLAPGRRFARLPVESVDQMKLWDALTLTFATAKS